MSREAQAYELFAVPAQEFHLIRTEEKVGFLSGLFVVLHEASSSSDQQSKDESGGSSSGWNPNIGRESGAWLHVGEDDTVTAFTGKVEVGQDIRTTLAQVAAEELCMSPESVQLVMADTFLTPYDMGTFGSRTTPITVPQFRCVAAAARELLLGLAAQKANVARATLTASHGQVVHSQTRRAFTFGELVRDYHEAKLLSVPISLKKPHQWEVSGKSVTKTNARALVTGKHRYTSDLRQPDMMWGKVLRPPTFGATLEWLDATVVKTIPDALVVHEENFVGVVAPHPAIAERALDSLKAEWKHKEHAPGSGEFTYKTNSDAIQGGRNLQPFVQGSLSQGFAEAEHILEANYSIAYIAHAPLEPRAALAKWDIDGEYEQLTVWTGTQRPFGVRDELADAFSLSPERVRVIVPDTGSGYGGKHTGEAAIEAARLARAAGKPVKLVWTREEEFTWAYNRPGGLIEVKAGFESDGSLTAWEFHNTNSGSAGLRTPYTVPNQHLEFHEIEAPLRQGSYRALASTANHFARETFMDEIAHKLGIDPLKMRLQNLGNERMRAALLAAAEGFGWNAQCQMGHGFGLAVGTEKGGFVATCAEVRMQDNQIKVVRLTTAFECGAIINPDNLRNQIEGALVQGLGGALFEAVEWAKGRILTECFSRYRVPRFSDTSAMETILLNRPDLPSEGAGESPLIAVAPAIGNALFMATGERRRSLPLAPNNKVPES